MISRGAKLPEIIPGIFSALVQDRIKSDSLDPPYITDVDWRAKLLNAGSVIIDIVGEACPLDVVQNGTQKGTVHLIVGQTISPCSGERVFYPHQISEGSV